MEIEGRVAAVAGGASGMARATVEEQEDDEEVQEQGPIGHEPYHRFVGEELTDEREVGAAG